jgi:DNA-binding MarR family transcriptional regulator
LISDREARRLHEAIRLIVRRFSLAERADVTCCGMTVAQAATLDSLAEAGLRLGDLGQRLGIAPSTLSRNLDRLVERGLIHRFPDPHDRRALRAELTPEGRIAAAEVRRHEIELARDILERLPAGSSAETLETIDRLLEAVRSATEDCCPGAYDHLFRGGSAVTKINDRSRE